MFRHRTYLLGLALGLALGVCATEYGRRFPSNTLPPTPYASIAP